LVKFLPERSDPALQFSIAFTARYQRTKVPRALTRLRLRRERPRGRRAPDQRDELAPSPFAQMHG
jgi:hypothetical protein